MTESNPVETEFTEMMDSVFKIGVSQGRLEMRKIIMKFIEENNDSNNEAAHRAFMSILELMLETINEEIKVEAPLPA